MLRLFAQDGLKYLLAFAALLSGMRRALIGRERTQVEAMIAETGKVVANLAA